MLKMYFCTLFRYIKCQKMEFYTKKIDIFDMILDYSVFTVFSMIVYPYQNFLKIQQGHKILPEFEI